MTLAQGLTAIIVFWAIIGGLGASLLLPAMQSLIHGNFEGKAQKKTYALVGAAAAIAAAVGLLLGGSVTTYLSWRVGFLLEAAVIAVVLSHIGCSRTSRIRASGRSTGSAPSAGRRGAAPIPAAPSIRETEQRRESKQRPAAGCLIAMGPASGERGDELRSRRSPPGSNHLTNARSASPLPPRTRSRGISKTSSK
jgi:MFS family permease